MPKKVNEFLTLLLNKAGVNVSDEAIKTALAVPELANVEVPDNVITGIDNGLISLTQAKNNHSEIKNHYFAQAYDGLDKELSRFMEDHKLPDEVKAELLGEKSSTKRAVMLSAKIKDLEEKKATSGKGEKDTLQAEINKLNAELRTTKEGIQGIHTDYAKKMQEIRMNHALGTLLSGYKTIYDALPPDVKEITLKALINKSLASDSAELNIDEQGNLSIKKKDGANIFGENNVQHTPNTYLDKIFSRDKILVVNDQNNNQNQNQNNNGSGANNNSQFYRNNNGQNNNQNRQNQNNNGNGNNNGQPAVNHTLQNLVSDSLKALESSEKQAF